MRTGLVGALGVTGSADQIQRDLAVIVLFGDGRADTHKNLNTAISSASQLRVNGPLRSSDVLGWLPCAVPSTPFPRQHQLLLPCPRAPESTASLFSEHRETR